MGVKPPVIAFLSALEVRLLETQRPPSYGQMSVQVHNYTHILKVLFQDESHLHNMVQCWNDGKKLILFSQTLEYISPDWMDLHTVCTGAPIRKQIVVSSIKNDAKMKQNPAALRKER